MGKIDVPIATQPVTPSSVSPSMAGKDEGFTVDKAKILSMVSQSTPLPKETTSDDALEQISLRRMLDLDPMSEDFSHEIKGILEFAKENNLNEKDLSSKIKELRYKLGNMGESAPKMIYHWLKLDYQIRSLVTKQAQIEDGRL